MCKRTPFHLVKIVWIGLLLIFLFHSNYGNCQIRKAKRHYELGTVLLKQGNYQKSIESFTEALQIQLSKDAYFNRAIAYSKLNMTEESCEDFLSSASLNDSEARKIYDSKCISVDTINGTSRDSGNYFYMVRTDYNYKDLTRFRQFNSQDSCILSFTDSKGRRSYEMLEDYAHFEGGVYALDSFVNYKLNYSENAALSGIEGTVVASFIIDEEGNLRSVEFSGTANKRLEKEVLLVLQAMPLWEPATYNKNVVRNTIYCLFTFGADELPLPLGLTHLSYGNYMERGLELNRYPFDGDNIQTKIIEGALTTVKWHFSGQYPNKR